MLPQSIGKELNLSSKGLVNTICIVYKLQLPAIYTIYILVYSHFRNVSTSKATKLYLRETLY